MAVSDRLFRYPFRPWWAITSYVEMLSWNLDFLDPLISPVQIDEQTTTQTTGPTMYFKAMHWMRWCSKCGRPFNHCSCGILIVCRLRWLDMPGQQFNEIGRASCRERV